VKVAGGWLPHPPHPAPSRRKISSSQSPQFHFILSNTNTPKIFEIGGKFETSLVDHSSIHMTSNNTIHLLAVISDPVFNMLVTPPDLAQFRLALKCDIAMLPPLLFEPSTHVIFSGRLSRLSVDGFPTIEVPDDQWGLVTGDSEDQFVKFNQAAVVGSGYVVRLDLNFNSPWRSYALVVDPSVKKVCVFLWQVCSQGSQKMKCMLFFMWGSGLVLGFTHGVWIVFVSCFNFAGETLYLLRVWQK
jgi:hypothetical protein